MFTPRCSDILRALESKQNRAAREGMARYGINTARAYGVSIPTLRAMAKEIGTSHSLALELWTTGIHEARLLAGFVGDAPSLSRKEMETWVRDFDSWDVCDQVCSNLFDKSPHAWAKAAAWAGRKHEFVKRAGFVLMAALAVHDKAASDARFRAFLSVIEKQAGDDRNFVKKAVNWALRQIGKRNLRLHAMAVGVGRRLEGSGSRAAQWVARDALRELLSPEVLGRLRQKVAKRSRRRRHQ